VKENEGGKTETRIGQECRRLQISSRWSSDRVTWLGEFSPIGQVFSITIIARKLWAYHMFYTEIVIYYLWQKGVWLHFGRFSYKPIRSPCPAKLFFKFRRHCFVFGWSKKKIFFVGVRQFRLICRNDEPGCSWCRAKWIVKHFFSAKARRAKRRGEFRIIFKPVKVFWLTCFRCSISIAAYQKIVCKH
jgi:hypothetical protein